jgi:hypothetical protein
VPFHHRQRLRKRDEGEPWKKKLGAAVEISVFAPGGCMIIEEEEGFGFCRVLEE